MFKFLTSSRKKWWKERKINWEHDYLSTFSHPHRALIVAALQSFNWISLWEIGVGGGANIMRILRDFQVTPERPRQLHGSDVNPDAVAFCQKTFTGGKFRVESAEKLFMSDKSVDVTLSDATLIYLGPGKIQKAIKELVRVSRQRIVLCEFHGTSLWKRWLLRLKTGYNAYNYQKLLEDAGCWDIQIVKMPEQLWAGFPWQPWGHVIVARVPNT